MQYPHVTYFHFLYVLKLFLKLWPTFIYLFSYYFFSIFLFPIFSYFISFIFLPSSLWMPSFLLTCKYAQVAKKTSCHFMFLMPVLHNKHKNTVHILWAQCWYCKIQHRNQIPTTLHGPNKPMHLVLGECLISSITSDCLKKKLNQRTTGSRFFQKPLTGLMDFWINQQFCRRLSDRFLDFFANYAFISE